MLEPNLANSAIDAATSIVLAAAELIVFTIAISLYTLPSIIALSRRHPNGAAIVVLNLLLGWLVVGWVVSLAMSLTSIHRPPAALAADQPLNDGTYGR